jgi:hypothetical protein
MTRAQSRAFGIVAATAIACGCGTNGNLVGATCQSGSLDCNGLCVDTQIDSANCGACGTSCSTGKECRHGACALICSSTSTACDGVCVNSLTDNANCGACAVVCPGGTFCSGGGTCAVSCIEGFDLCTRDGGNYCANLSNDESNCGTCGKSCPHGQFCLSGACAVVCPDGSLLCDGLCVNPLSDNANCGGCAMACPSGTVCNGQGTCAAACPNGSTFCGGLCVNTLTDDRNCGACARACPSGTFCNGAGSCAVAGCTWIGDICYVTSCVGVVRGATCSIDGGLGLCFGGVCHEGLDLSTDPQNCGDYGVVCPPGVACQYGQCNVVDCLNDAGVFACPTGTQCSSTGCVATYCVDGGDDVACSTIARGFCCGGSCLINTDAQNCGGCGVTCNGLCKYDYCLPYPPCDAGVDGVACRRSGGRGTCCGGSCVDLGSDQSNCSACGYACTFYCDPEGCGALSTPCEGGCPDGSACYAGGCAPSSCTGKNDGSACVAENGGLLVCCGGSCSDTSSDGRNCGGCGLSCVYPDQCILGTCGLLVACQGNGDRCTVDGGAPGYCCAGECVPSYYRSGFWLLSASLLTPYFDDANCGQCGQACAPGTTCQISGSPSCIGDAGIGCGDGCPAGSDCQGGFCLPFTCDGGSATCAVNGSPATCCGDLCTQLGSDDQNCGGCGGACAAGLSCVSGACIDPSSGQGCGAQFPCPLGSICSESACFAPSCLGGSEGRLCAYGPQALGVCCGGTCVDPANDARNCGQCGLWCSSGYCQSGFGCTLASVPQDCLQSCVPGTLCAGGLCVDGVCEKAPPRGLRALLGAQRYCSTQDGGVGSCCPSGACADLALDDRNCGGCGVICPAGQSCQNGLCNGLLECASGRAGSYCNLDAGLSYLCCPGSGCADTSTDSSNCGACGAVCPNGHSCTAGSCG